MADYSFGGSEEENAELRKLEAELVSTFSLIFLHF
jgi:pre-mRNA-processing factor 39